MIYLEDDAERMVGRFLTKGPLYGVLSVKALIPVDPKLVYYIPDTVLRDCETCQQETTWDQQNDLRYLEPSRFAEVRYICRNCREVTLHVWLTWSLKEHQVWFVKVGQSPKFEINPPKELAEALGDQAKLYTKGLTLRHHGYGLGAHSYFRRLIEDTTNEMLELVATALEETGSDEGLVKQVRAAKEGKAYQDKVKFIADVLPRHLRPGDINPFSLLHDLLSEGLHNLSEEQCIEIVDGMNGALTYIYKELKAHAQEQKSYMDGLKVLQAKQAKRKLS